ncbi:membrane protein insertion efficiency factor YidD [Legionella quinlivanii]|uniref:membrane protein insertion efficiency factor YidD n=1 Tax=Legionella quinlivanii TaxID=45073 RepID=UPI0007309FE7|nr:membrane protein insertion efficiency factor YidD [Legionella quinlivanii]MCW8452247.1 membrane protein insertion efficiency factor YidD [Legionella quinlivanii]
MGKTNQILRQLAGIPIRLYQLLIRPVMRPCCRFYPSCSDYALSAIQQFGICKGIWYAIGRLLRCHPWADGGFDPVLPKEEKP